MKIVFLEADTLGNDVDLSIFQAFGELVLYGKSNPAENATRIQDADVVVVNKIRMDEALLKNATQIKLICLTATGTNNIDFAYTNQRGITVANVKGYSTMSVAQHTFALLFYLYEKMNAYDAYVKTGKYAESNVFSYFTPTFHELDGKVWGIVGLGAIGEQVAKIAQAFGCQVQYFSTTGKNQNDNYKQVEWEELLASSDIISIHAPLHEKTEGIFGREAFGKMKPTAYLINVGRGAIVNQEELAEALETQQIAGAGLDVLVEEPIAKDDCLMKIKDSNRLVITPHIAWATVEARQRCVEEVYQNILSWQNGEERNVVG